MKLIRKLHLYLGCFFAPLLIFYTATGWYQTLQSNRNKTEGEGESWIMKFTSIHVDQIYPAEHAEAYSPVAFQWLVVAMSIGLLTTVILGVYLAFRLNKKKWPVWTSLILGFLVPILLLYLGIETTP